MITHTIGFYAVKVSAIFIMSFFYFVMGSILSVLLNDVIPDARLEEISTSHLMVILGVIFGCIGVVFYVLRNLVKRMPFFLDGVYGFKYSLLREAAGGLIVAYTMYSYLDKLKAMMVELGHRLRGETKQKQKETEGERERESGVPQA